jgi:glycosyl transferase family 25
MLFDHFDQIRIVSLADRRDRRRFMSRQINELGLGDDRRVRFFDAYRTSDRGLFRKPGSHGCFLSHLEILRSAATRDESVLILQDDCEFFPEIRTYELPECDIFYGGYYRDDSSPGEGIIGAHFMGFSRLAASTAALYLQDYLLPDFPPDKVAAEDPRFDPAIRPPIDGAFVWFRRAHPDLRTEFALLSRQTSSRSDISPHFADRLPVLRDAAAVFRHIRSAVRQSIGA